MFGGGKYPLFPQTPMVATCLPFPFSRRQITGPRGRQSSYCYTDEKTEVQRHKENCKCHVDSGRFGTRVLVAWIQGRCY